jgi:homoserine O-succinyltransferase/O-acetyltransferase
MAALSLTAPSGAAEPLRIGLVNNMPDAALRPTERQFGELLLAAVKDMPVRLMLFSLPEVSRGEEAAAHIRRSYHDFAALRDTRIDGLIVTGMPPRAATIEDEPYWRSLTRLIDWAEDNTLSAIWSCLAAHAAVLHLDGIRRRRLPEKLSGLYECVRTGDHALLAGTPHRWRVPHSRYNELPPAALLSANYRILSNSAAAGADIFCKDRGSLFIFLQGHPEYDAGALMREYRRDVAAYLGGRSADYPRMPRAYFDRSQASAFAAFRRRALARRDPGLLGSFPVAQIEPRPGRGWHGIARRFYANWLALVAERRERRAHAVSAVTARMPALAPVLGGDA